jgi:hypothetical protein
VGGGPVIAAGTVLIAQGNDVSERSAPFGVTCDSGKVAGRGSSDSRGDNTTGERVTKLFVQSVSNLEDEDDFWSGDHGVKSNRVKAKCPNLTINE